MAADKSKAKHALQVSEFRWCIWKPPQDLFGGYETSVPLHSSNEALVRFPM
jgi:hypothetical protein